MTTTPAIGPDRPGPGRTALLAVTAPIAPRTLEALVVLALDATVAVVISLPIVVLVIVTLSSAPVLPVALVLLALLLGLTRVTGHLERARFRAVPGIEMTSPHRPLPGPWYRTVLGRVTSAATWKELAYHLVRLPTALVVMTITVVTWSAALALATLPLYVGHVPAERARLGPWTIADGPAALAAGALGVVLLLLAPWPTRGFASLSAGLARGLLGGEAVELRERVGTLEATRAGVVDAAEAERRRIERDLHDGAQQRLVALSMSLGLAREKIDDDPEQARALVEEAHREAKAAMVELRDLVRGLHPPVLTDRGLEAAVAGLASRSPVPVTVDVVVATRPPQPLEGIAYFVISEALTNVARHSGARQASVRVRTTDRSLVVEVHDDGHGGARPDAGSGLRGLHDRLAAVDGTLVVSSPPGGPTTVRAEIPLPTLGALDPSGGPSRARALGAATRSGPPEVPSRPGEGPNRPATIEEES